MVDVLIQSEEGKFIVEETEDILGEFAPSSVLTITDEGV